MRSLILAICLSLTGQAVAQESSSVNSSLESTFYSANANHQNNYAFGSGQSSRSTFSRGAVTCDAPRLVVGAIPSWNQGFIQSGTRYGGNNSVTAGVSLIVPFGSTVERCKQMQRTIIRSADLQYMNDTLKHEAETMKHEFKAAMLCLDLKKKGVILNVEQFAFAERCNGVMVIAKASIDEEKSEDQKLE